MTRPNLRQFLLVCCICLVLPARALADDKPEQPLITVTGEAEVMVAPDEVVFDLTVQTFNKDLRVAKSQADERVKRIMELTQRYKIAPQDVQTDSIKLTPRYRGNDEARLLLGYSVRKDLVFTLRDVSQAENLLSEVMESGISRINSLRFQTSQLRKFKDQARAMAIKAAQEKATAMTAEIGQKIGKAYSIEEEVPPPVNTAYQNSFANLSANTTTFEGGDTTASEGTLALGLIKVNARVTVRFVLN